MRRFEKSRRLLTWMASAILFAPTVSAASACEDGHWIDEVLNDGAVIVLEDRSVWLVDDGDRVDTALWLPVTEIVVCGNMLINTDDGEKAHARRVR